MNSPIPYARNDVSTSSINDIIAWLRVDELLEKTKQLPPDTEFSLLIEFLIEFSGGYELAEHRMYEMCVEQATLSYKAYAEVLKRIKNRISQLYYEKGKRREMEEST